MKERVKESSYREKVTILTLVPESWSREYASRFFNVSEYLIRTARSVKEAKGVLADTNLKTGKRLAECVEEMMQLIYDDDEYSRAMPRKKDFVSIGQNIHKQKRLLLCNVKELYAEFKQKNPQMEIGLSKFCSLRPKWCVNVGASGSHNVCVCMHHQNAILLVNALSAPCTYNDLMKMIVCDVQRNECMLHRCSECPDTKPLRDFVTADLVRSVIDEMEYSQWQSTDRPTLIKSKSSTEEYIDTLVSAISDLTAHSFISKCQSRYFKNCRENLSPISCIIVLDFAENYKFVGQDEIQSFHWNNQQYFINKQTLLT